MESKLLENDKLFLSKLVKLCKSRSTYRFTFSNRTTYINKFTSYSSEYNIINICQAGAGRLKQYMNSIMLIVSTKIFQHIILRGLKNRQN